MHGLEVPDSASSHQAGRVLEVLYTSARQAMHQVKIIFHTKALPQPREGHGKQRSWRRVFVVWAINAAGVRLPPFPQTQ